MSTILKISKNRYRGAKIRDLREIAELVKERRAVIISYPGWRSVTIKPAAWIINQQGRWINSMIENEILYYCIKYEEL